MLGPLPFVHPRTIRRLWMPTDIASPGLALLVGSLVSAFLGVRILNEYSPTCYYESCGEALARVLLHSQDGASAYLTTSLLLGTAGLAITMAGVGHRTWAARSGHRWAGLTPALAGLAFMGLSITIISFVTWVFATHAPGCVRLASCASSAYEIHVRVLSDLRADGSTLLWTAQLLGWIGLFSVVVGRDRLKAAAAVPT